MHDVSDKPTLHLALACCLLLKVLSETVQVVWYLLVTIVKSMLRASLLKVAVATAQMAVARMWLGDG